jgi:hypothetical protein
MQLGANCMKRMVVGSLATMTAVFSVVAETESTQVHFANSCKPEVQEEFDHGITLLHSFEYPETTRLFGVLSPIGSRPRWTGSRLA